MDGHVMSHACIPNFELLSGSMRSEDRTRTDWQGLAVVMFSVLDMEVIELKVHHLSYYM